MQRWTNSHRNPATQQAFARTWRKAGAARAPRLDDIVARYSEPGRAYHTFEHVLECLAWAAACGGLAQRPPEVELALVYHDVVYEPGRSDNEARSADLFRHHAVACGLPSAATRRVASLVEGTADHAPVRGDGALVNDIDLAVLGASPRRFARYEAAIRHEYRRVDAAAFRRGRARVLRSFLETFSIYGTAFFRDRLEVSARTNLCAALQSLESDDVT